MTSVIHRESRFVDLMKTTLSFAIAFKKEYKKKFVANRIPDIVKEMMGLVFLTGISAECYYR